MLRHELVNQTVGVALEAVGIAAALPVGGYVGVGFDFGEGIGVAGAEVARGDGVECVLGEGRVVHCSSVGGELEAVETFLLPLDGHAALTQVEGVTLVAWDVVFAAEDGCVLGEASPGVARAEIDHDEAGATFVGGVNEVGDALAGGIAQIGVEVEAEIVQVAVWVVHAGWKGVGVVYRVVRQTDGYEFRASRLGVGHTGVALSTVDGRTPGVDCPQGFRALCVA